MRNQYKIYIVLNQAEFSSALANEFSDNSCFILLKAWQKRYF